MSSGDWVAVCGIVVTILIAVIAGLLRKIGQLQTKVETKNETIEAKNETISELKRQNDKLEITGTLANRFFSQLPAANEFKREIQQ